MDKIRVLINREQLNDRINILSNQIEKDYKDKDLHIICVLKGSVFFTMDLIRNINQNVRLDFVKIKSYNGTKSGEINFEANLISDIDNKDVLIIEDIIDSGKTMNYLTNYLRKNYNPRSIKVCTLLDKKEKREISFTTDYTGFVVDDKFVIGYGLDYDEDYRNLPYIGYVDDEDIKHLKKDR